MTREEAELEIVALALTKIFCNAYPELDRQTVRENVCSVMKMLVYGLENRSLLDITGCLNEANVLYTVGVR